MEPAERAIARGYSGEPPEASDSGVMPAEFFAAAIGGVGDGLEAIGTRRAKCGTSFEAAAIRYARTNHKPVAVNRGAGRGANRGAVSAPPKRFRGIDRIPTGTPMPSESATAEFNEDTGNTARGEREKRAKLPSGSVRRTAPPRDH